MRPRHDQAPTWDIRLGIMIHKAVLRPSAGACAASYLTQDGTPEEESFQGSAMGPNGSCVLAGATG